jgi:CBS domain-containing protein
MTIHTRAADLDSLPGGTLGWDEPKDQRTSAELVRRRPTVVSPHMKARDVELLAANLRVNHFPVVDEGGELVGILCSCDLRSVRPDTEVVECMSCPPVTVDGAVPVREAAEMIRALDLGALLVLEESKLLGLITRGDLRRAALLTETERPRCSVCNSRHHVRIHPGSGAALCLDCQDRSRRDVFGRLDDGVTGGD